MKTALPPYVTRFESQHGNVRHRFRRGNVSRYLPDPRMDPVGFGTAYAEAMAAVGKPKPRGSKTLAAAAERYFKTTAFANQREISQQAMRRRIGWVVVEYGHYKCEHLTLQACDLILDRHRDKPGRREDFRRALMALGKVAVKEGWIKVNEAANTDRSRPAGKAAKRWESDKLAAYRAYWPLGTVQRLAFEIFLWTSQRSKDGYAMTLDHVLPPAAFAVPGPDGTPIQIELPRLAVVQSKTGAELVIPMHPAIGAALAACPPKGRYLLETRAGKQRAWKAGNGWFNGSVREALGEPGYTTHGLRRTAASIGAEEGLGDKAISGLTGHTSSAELNKYTKAADQERLAGSAIGAFVVADQRMAAAAAERAAAELSGAVGEE